MSTKSKLSLAQSNDNDFSDSYLPPTSTPKSLRTRLYDLYDANRGLLLIGCSTLTGNLMMTTVKLMNNQQEGTAAVTPTEQIPPTVQLIAIRQIITLIICEVWMHRKSIPHPFFGPPGVRHWLHIRGFTGFFGLFGAYYSVQYISLSDSTTIGFLVPFVTAFLGMVILKEPYSLKEAGAALVSFSGVLLIARPTFLFGSMSSDSHIADPSSMPSSTEPTSDHMRLVAISIGLLGVVGVALAFISLRRIASEAHTMHSVVYFSTWCLIASIFGTILYGIPWIMPSPTWIVGMITISILGFMGQLLVTMGFAREKAGRGTLSLYIAIVFSLMFDAIIFHHKPSFLSFLGIGIILSSAIYVALSKPADPRSSSPREADEEEEVGLMPLTQEDDGGEEDNMAETKQPRGGRSLPSLGPGKDVEVTEVMR